MLYKKHILLGRIWGIFVNKPKHQGEKKNKVAGNLSNPADISLDLDEDVGIFFECTQSKSFEILFLARSKSFRS